MNVILKTLLVLFLVVIAGGGTFLGLLYGDQLKYSEEEFSLMV